jgi:hypothetical protein
VILLSGVPAVPRTNNPESSASSSRNRGPAKTTEKTRIVGAAADMKMSTVTSEDTPNSPTYDEIAEAAYQRYLRRGGGDGRDVDDWVEAERELRVRRTQQ